MLIVNITTTSNRLDLCSSTVYSLLNQSMIPDEINVWISREGYMSDEGIQHIPKWVGFLNSKHNIIKFRYTENTGPYRKIIPALRFFNDTDRLVYADDDVVYGKNWLNSLVNLFESQDEKYVVASRVRIKQKNFLSRYKSYSTYNICNKDIVLASDYIITGVGGCILTKSHIDNKYINDDEFFHVAPKTDDLWISKIIQLSNTSVMVCTEALNNVFEIEHSCGALNQINNVSYNSSLIKKVYKKILYRFLSYFGCTLSNNDFSQRKIDDYFRNN